MKALVLLLFCVCVIIPFAVVLLKFSTVDTRRDALLQSQLQQIAQAQTVEDLKPLLEQIVRKQRHDYK